MMSEQSNTNPAMEISVHPIEPQGNLYGFAKVTVGGITMNDFKIVSNKDGELFVGMPSKPDKNAKTGYRNMAYVDKDFRDDFTAAVIGEYHATVEKLQTHAAAAKDKPRMADQVTEAEKQAAKHNATRKAPAKTDLGAER